MAASRGGQGSTQLVGTKYAGGETMGGARRNVVFFSCLTNFYMSVELVICGS